MNRAPCIDCRSASMFLCCRIFQFTNQNGKFRWSFRRLFWMVLVDGTKANKYGTCAKREISDWANEQHRHWEQSDIFFFENWFSSRLSSRICCRWSKWSDLLTDLFQFGLAWFILTCVCVSSFLSTESAKFSQKCLRCSGNSLKSFANCSLYNWTALCCE